MLGKLKWFKVNSQGWKANCVKYYCI